MAYSTLRSLENTINQILDQDRFAMSPHEKKQITSLDRFVISFQAFLEDFPEQAKILEARMRDAAAEAEDIIESFFLKQTRNKNGNIKLISVPVQRSIKFNRRLHRVRDEMDSIAAEVVEIQNSITTENKLQPGNSVGASSSSQGADTGKINVVGFNEDLIEIKEKLCGWAPQLQILTIFGMGGIGKTTLARTVYIDQLVVEHFQIRVWLTISQDCSKRRILLDLLDSLKEFDPMSMQERSEQGDECNDESLKKTPELSNIELAVKVHKILTARRFLIIMDDIWSTEVLNDVKQLFPDDNNGSRIILTTRLAEIATYASSTTLSHEMSLMNSDQSWNLLCQKVFIHQDRVPQELESIGREIASNCGGLPLAIVVIAGLLSTKSKTLTSWEEVARNIRSSLASEDGQIEKILSLSYDRLPHHLRPCFLYMGGFPEDHEIKATDLMWLWIAERFVKPVASKEFEDTAEEYLQELVDRSLIIITRRKSNGKTKCCKLHDMVREMCIKLCREEKFIVHAKDIRRSKFSISMKGQRRLIFSGTCRESLFNFSRSNIRTIVYFQDYHGSLSFKGFRLLRVLVLLTVPYLPKLNFHELFNLFHLRYLALCSPDPIPRSISNLQSLQSLQTLIIKGSYSYFPLGTSDMLQLRHLVISNCGLADTNACVFALENLQTLGTRNLRCSVSMLKLIPNLTKLCITYSRGSGELLLHNIVHLHLLRNLHLELGFGWICHGKPNLVVPSSLKKLTLTGWGRRKPYFELVGPFPNLQVLKLKRFNFTTRVWRTSDEDFPQLIYLLIEESDIEEWETESSHFPSLKALHVRSCRGLSEIPESIGEIPTLELIELKLCTGPLVNSAKQIQEVAQSYGYDDFQVSCIDCDPIPQPPPPPPRPRPRPCYGEPFPSKSGINSWDYFFPVVEEEEEEEESLGNDKYP